MRKRGSLVVIGPWLILFGTAHSLILASSTDPTLFVRKSIATNDVVLSWSATTAEYSVSRNTSPNFFGIVTPTFLAANTTGTEFRDPGLFDGTNGFYLVHPTTNISGPCCQGASCSETTPPDDCIAAGNTTTLGDETCVVNACNVEGRCEYLTLAHSEPQNGCPSGECPVPQGLVVCTRLCSATVPCSPVGTLETVYYDCPTAGECVMFVRCQGCGCN